MMKHNKQIMAKWLTYMTASCMLLFSSGNLFAQGGAFTWATRAGGSSSDAGRSIASDNAGNVYTIADFQGDIDFTMKDGSALKLTTRGGYDIFISKQDADGNFIWVKQIGGSGPDHAYGLDVDGDGNIYGTGYFQSTMFFGDPSNNQFLTSAGLSDAFTCKLNTDGDVLWLTRFGGGGSDYSRDITVDNTGNTYTIGYFSGSMDVDLISGKQTFTSAGGDETVIMKQNPNGGIEWMKQIGGSGNDRGWSIAVDESGNVYSTGYYAGKADFDPGTGAADTFFMEAVGSNDAYVLKLDNAGNFVWARNIGGLKSINGNGIAVDQSGNAYVTGYFSGDCDFDAQSSSATLSSYSQVDIFIAKFNTQGDFQWAQHMGGKGDDYGRSVSVDISGNCYVLSYFNKLGTFGTDTLSAAGGDDISISKLDPQGNFLWNKSVGGSGTDRAWSIRLDVNSSIYVTGNFANTADFDPGTRDQDTFFLASAGGNDIFMLKLGCTDTSSAQLTEETCLDTFYLGDVAYTKAGNYTQRFSNAAGCDSTVYLALTFVKLNPVINVQGFTLSTVITYDTYQWLLNGSAIPGATNDHYTVTQNGDYQVVVTSKSGCIDTSDVYTVNNAGIEDVPALAGMIKVYPNPATDKITIQSPVKVAITLTDVTGRTVKQVADAQEVSLSSLAAGIYLLRITDQAGTLIKVEKVVKQER